MDIIYKKQQLFFDQQARKTKFKPLLLKSAYSLEYLDLIKWLILEAKAREDLNILDVGCGIGQYLVWFNTFTKAYGIDISLDSIRCILSTSKRRCAQANFISLPFKTKTFDLVFSNHSLEHTTDKKLVLKEFYRVLKDKGILFIATPNRFALPELWVDITFQTYYRQIDGHVGILSLRKVIEMVETNGFKIERRLSQSVIYPGGLAIPLIGRYLSLNPFIFILSKLSIKAARLIIKIERLITTNTFLKYIGYDIILVCQKI